MSLATSLPSTTTDAVRELRLTMRGPALVASDGEYDSARRIWNGTVDRRPSVFARCVDDLDVMAAVRCARRYGLPLSVLGGGHDWAGRALRDGGLVIDLGAMRRVRVDPESATASVQGAARAGEVLAAARPHGLAPVTGVINKVGLTGLTLGGAHSASSRSRRAGASRAATGVSTPAVRRMLHLAARGGTWPCVKTARATLSQHAANSAPPGTAAIVSTMRYLRPFVPCGSTISRLAASTQNVVVGVLEVPASARSPHLVSWRLTAPPPAPTV